MEKEPPYRLIRDALGFYSQVPITEPEEAPVVEEVVVPLPPPVKRKGGRPPKKKLNAEFEVDV